MRKETKKEIENALKVILNIVDRDKVQMFDCYDIAGDYKEVFFKNDEVEVLYAPHYEYVEIIGLSDKDYNYFLKKYGY